VRPAGARAIVFHVSARQVPEIVVLREQHMQWSLMRGASLRGRVIERLDPGLMAARRATDEQGVREGVHWQQP
jgi:hypothetical protein